MHVMVTKPLVKTLAEHRKIVQEAKNCNVLVCLEFHKRYDPIYNDAVNRIRGRYFRGRCFDIYIYIYIYIYQSVCVYRPR